MPIQSCGFVLTALNLMFILALLPLLPLLILSLVSFDAIAVVEFLLATEVAVLDTAESLLV